MFPVLNMTPEQLRSKIATEGWDEEFVDKAIENATIGENDVYSTNLSLQDEILRDDDETIRIVYCYQRLLDEDNIPGIYCTVFCNEVPDLYAKHTLMDYGHGGYPFVVSTFERNFKKALRLPLHPRSRGSVPASHQSRDGREHRQAKPRHGPPGRTPARPRALEVGAGGKSTLPHSWRDSFRRYPALRCRIS